MSVAFVDALLGELFGAQGPPPWLDALIDRPLVAELIEDYKLNPVLPSAPGARARIALSDRGDPERWTAGLRAAFPSRRTRAFMALAPPGARRMLDTDGVTATAYLDDLQEVAHALPSPTGGPLICLSVPLPRGPRTLVTRHEAPPLSLVTGHLSAALERLVDAGAGGLWGVRWRGERPTAALWITEARWRGDSGAKAALFERAYPGHPRLAALTALARAHGLRTYPDAVELSATGEVELTVGFLREQAAPTP